MLRLVQQQSRRVLFTWHPQYMSTLTPLNMPALSPTMETGTLSSWNMKEGDVMGPGDVLCQVETDKAVVDYEMQDDAVLAKIMVPEGTADIPVGALLAYTVEDEDEYADFLASGQIVPAAETTESTVPSETTSDQPVMVSETNTVRHRTPLIKFLGKRSLLSAPKAASPAISTAAPVLESNDEYMDIPVSTMRRVIASRLTESKATVPHAYSSIDCEIDAVLAMRKRFKLQHQVNVSLNDFILKSVAGALRDVPEANCTWNEAQKRQEANESVDISVAVATDAGLITPIVEKCHEKRLGAIHETFTELVGRARENRLKPHEFQGGSFTVSNLGGFGITSFTAVINPPQACILAVGGGQKRVVMSQEDKSTPRIVTKMNVTLSSDRRVVSDVVAARFLQSFQTYMQHPELLLV